RRANQVARYLQAQGVGPEQIVGLCLDRTPQMVVGMLGVLKAGGAYLPLDPSYPAERLAYLVKDTAASVLLMQSQYSRRLAIPGVQEVCLDTQWGEIGLYPDGALGSEGSADSLAYVMYTSGSTGEPKGVAVTQANIVRLVKGADYCQAGPQDVFLQAAAPSF